MKPASWLLPMLLILVATAARAEVPRAETHYVKACGLTGSPAAVVVDVYDDAAPGSILDTIMNADVDRIGTTDCYQVDLAATAAAIAYPAAGDSTPESYSLTFRDDSGNEVWLTEQVFGMVGALATDRSCERAIPVYPTATVPVRGITQQVIERGSPSYLSIEIDCSRQFTGGSITGTYYEVLRYDNQGRVESRTPGATAPSP